MRLLHTILFVCLGFLGTTLAGPAQDQKKPDPAALEKQRCPRPDEFALVFSLGYAKDLMPPEDDRFEKLLQTIKAGGFNTVHCTYTPERLALCEKHGVKMMIDLLVEQHHVYKSPDKAQAVCEKLRKHPAVWGYNVWNDPFGKSAEGRRRDINNVRLWDPSHPVFCGTYRTGGMKSLTNADLMGYYDFHWKRGTAQHFPHLLAYAQWARERDAWFYTWLSATSGQPGEGNFLRSRYSAHTGIACGLKGILWFLGTDLIDTKTLEWSQRGKDVVRINQEILPVAKELGRVGLPISIYSTAITQTLNNQPLPDKQASALPPGLEKQGFPKDFWLQPAGGEFVLGVFPADKGKELAYVANHNAYAPQQVALKLGRATTVSWFDRQAARWQALEVRDGVVRFRLAEGGGELLRFGE